MYVVGAADWQVWQISLDAQLQPCAGACPPPPFTGPPHAHSSHGSYVLAVVNSHRGVWTAWVGVTVTTAMIQQFVHHLVVAASDVHPLRSSLTTARLPLKVPVPATGPSRLPLPLPLPLPLDVAVH